MTELATKTCEACRADAPKLNDQAIQAHLTQLDGWQVEAPNGVNQLVKTYSFKNYVQATAFANVLCNIAEENAHHPAALIEWGKVTVRWWSHKIKGLHENDFIMAAKTDLL